MKYLFPKIVGFFRDDHSIYIDVKNIPGKRQSILIDCGNNHTLAMKDFIRLSTVLISHAHIDHLIGFDNILRMNLREKKRIRIIGPAPLSKILHHRLQGYIWNLIYDSSFEIEVWDIHPRIIKKYLFRCCEGFAKKYFIGKMPATTILLNNDYYQCSYIRLDHDIPSIGYTLEEKDTVKLDKNKLKELNLPEGKWIQKLKSGDFSKSETISGTDGKPWSMVHLHNTLISRRNGFKISYISDTILNRRLEKNIVEMVKHSDILYCESTFMHKDRHLAEKYYHLTARQAGYLAKQAQVKQLYLIHLSLRYSNPYSLLKQAQEQFPNTKFPKFSKVCHVSRKV